MLDIVHKCSLLAISAGGTSVTDSRQADDRYHAIGRNVCEQSESHAAATVFGSRLIYIL